MTMTDKSPPAAPAPAATGALRDPMSYVNVAVPFIKAAREVFASMLAMEMTPGKPFLKTATLPAQFISGIIGFGGDIAGNVVVSFPREVATVLVQKFAGINVAPDHPDFLDAIGELTNIIVGGAKSSMGGSINISVPSVIYGAGYTVAHKAGAPCLVVPCKCGAGEFIIEITFQQKSK